MRSGMTADWSVYRNYIYYLEKALAKIAQKKENIVTKKVYRGIADKLENYNKGRIITWNSFSSCTTDATVAFNFMREKKGTIIMISCKSAKGISKLSAIPKENEALYSSNARFKINGIASQETKSFLEDIVSQDLSEIDVIQLEEIRVLGGKAQKPDSGSKPKIERQSQKPEIDLKPKTERPWRDLKSEKQSQKPGGDLKPSGKQCNNCAKFIANGEKFQEHIRECNARYKAQKTTVNPNQRKGNPPRSSANPNRKKGW